MAAEREVPKKRYPPEVNYSTVLRGMVRTSPLDSAFHILMAILLITGLIIDLLGPWLGGWLSSIRSIAHGYVGAIFVLVFIVYIIAVAISKAMRTVLTVTNYVDFLLYIVLTITGIAMASPNKPWINVFPGLSDALSPMVPYAPMIHVVTTYVWIVFATVFPGGILHGLASVYLISYLKKKIQNYESEVKRMKPENFIDNFGRSESLWMYACSRCGACVDVCPIYVETGDKYTTPGFKIKKMRGLITKKLVPSLGGADAESVKKVARGLYECTLCGRCWSVCPYDYDLVALWETARESAFETGFGQDPHTPMIEALKEEKNIFKRPHARRRDWTKGFYVPIREHADTVYFVGCLMAYRGQLKPAAKSMARILDAAGEDWTILKDEVCCGAPLKFAGATKHMEELMEANIRAIESVGARKIVFSCPGCYRMFWQEYSEVLGKRVRMFHGIELIDSYIRSGQIKLKKSDERMTYHDPCELSRLSGVIEEPRRVFANLTTQFVELPGNKFNVICCGGGGLYKAVDLDKSREIAKKRVALAEEKGATTLMAACPSCYMTISQAARLTKSDVNVIDVAEAVARQIE